MATCIVVPIKTINTRLPGKTFKEIAGKPLYTYLFHTLKKVKDSGTVSEIAVYSSDDKVLNISSDWGFQSIKQPPEYDTNPKVTGDFLITQTLKHLPSYNIFGWCHITSPFLSENSIENSINLLEANPDVDSVFGVVPRYNRFWFQNQPINHDVLNLIRTQDLNPVQEEADFYFFRRSSFEHYGKRICGNFKSVEVTRIEAVDIDNLEDLIYAESLIKAGLANV